ncbi:MAG: purine-binding chemotaxis protein CheW [Leptospirales bacterium]|nr:purine-binding chemotaxis protein CheW [Leptospirales bacterium]
MREDSRELQEEFLDDDEDTMQGRYLTFTIENRICGIEVRDVIEIVGLPPITAVPDMPDFVRGIINLRGKVIPVMEMRRRFMVEDKEHDERTCVVIVSLEDRLTGLIVDKVREVIRINDENLEEAPRVGSGESSRFIKQVGKIGDAVVLILDLDRLLNEKESARFRETAQLAATV